MTQKKAIDFLRNQPYKLGHLVGFDKLGDLHNKWIYGMVNATEDKTLQAHRGSFKTTCVSIALADIIILRPSLKTGFFRKTDTDVKEVIRQTKNILLHEATQYLTRSIYGAEIRLIESSSTTITTNLSRDTSVWQEKRESGFFSDRRSA